MIERIVEEVKRKERVHMTPLMELGQVQFDRERCWAMA